MMPAAQATGWYEKARAMFVLSVSSVTMLLITPTLPLSAPHKARLWTC